MNYQFHFYPTLLNEFRRYKVDPSTARFEKLFNRINRIPETDPETLKKFKKGYSFEDAVLKGKPTDYDPHLILEARKHLPKHYKTQQFIQCMFDNIRFYGYADVVGENRVIDLKTTAVHKPGRHDLNFQNLYLYALKDYGFQSMEYVICDGEELYIENYHIDTYDFEPLLLELQEFASFLIENKPFVKDQKIIQTREKDLFS